MDNLIRKPSSPMRWLQALTVMVALSSAANAAAQTYRQDVKVPPIEVFQSMLTFAEAGEFQKVVGSLPVLSPILEHIDQKFKFGAADHIRSVSSGGDRASVVAAVEELIIWDMKDLLDESLTNLDRSIDAARTPIRTARFNYELLAPLVRRKAPPADDLIKRAFGEALRTMAAPGAPETVEATRKTIARQLTLIVFELAKVFPQRM